MSGMTFRGIRKDFLTVLQGRKRPPWTNLTRNILKIPGNSGGYLESTDEDPRLILVPILIKSSNLANLQKIKEELAEWLVTDDPEELIFDDEPDRSYFAVVEGNLDLEELVNVGHGVITFLCPDPYKYGPLKMALLPAETVSIENQGTADTYPLFRAKVKQPIVHLDFVSDQGYMRIGEPVSVQETPFEREQIIFDDNMATTTGWANGTSVDEGAVLGTMSSNGNDFYVSDYGTGASWHGPAKKKSLSEQIQDFRAEIYFNQDTFQETIGRVEASLLDVNNNVIAKISMADPWKDFGSNLAQVRLGDQTGPLIVDTAGAQWGAKWTGTLWKRFQGVMKLERVGQEFRVYIANIERGGNYTHFDVYQTSFFDVDNRFQGKVAQVQLHIGKYKDFPTPIHVFQRVRVYKINQTNPYHIPYVAQPGDVIEFDHAKSDIRINGQSRIDLKDFGSTYFPLVKGVNVLHVSPFGALEEMTVDWRERFK